MNLEAFTYTYTYVSMSACGLLLAGAVKSHKVRFISEFGLREFLTVVVVAILK